jgi:uncharacterized protein YfaS (alpha-2-macroglobulin family)
VTADAQGFKRAIITEVVVRSSSITRVDVSIDVGGTSETVTVTGSSRELPNHGKRDRIISVVTRQLVSLSPGVQTVQTSTPRLREYFPETLLWQPSLETDKQGRAQLKFKLADNITTWKMSVIGSTADGQIGTTEKEFTAFQPFFVEHDPPRILTEGDEISLPVVVRNYLNRDQNVNLEIKPESWFTLLNATKQDIKVPAGDSSRGTFDFRANGRSQRWQAKNHGDRRRRERCDRKAGDRASRRRRKISHRQRHRFRKRKRRLDIPASAIANSQHSELKIYPNLLAHVAESVEAIMSRPYWLRRADHLFDLSESVVAAQRQECRPGQPPAQASLRSICAWVYSRLLNYRHENGGFTYWGRGEPDLALTAYALRFLSQGP